tara:strand:+ start:64 stop:207 length:144 start_codon:yes stop_codon:yes gene_type:complete
MKINFAWLARNSGTERLWAWPWVEEVFTDTDAGQYNFWTQEKAVTHE